jgi:hypothetical protein
MSSGSYITSYHLIMYDKIQHVNRKWVFIGKRDKTVFLGSE